MSKTDSLHYQLCIEGAKWLHRQKRNINRCEKKYCHKPEFCRSCYRYKYVAVELCTCGTENCDVWGYDGIYTAVIEVKTSHADFLADQKKWWRGEEAEEMNAKAGTFRWYLCPEGIISPEEVPEGWGLLYWDGKKIIYVKGAPKHENTASADLKILSSILRRENFPQKIYNYRHQNTTIKPQKIYGNNESDYTIF